MSGEAPRLHHIRQREGPLYLFFRRTRTRCSRSMGVGRGSALGALLRASRRAALFARSLVLLEGVFR